MYLRYIVRFVVLVCCLAIVGCSPQTARSDSAGKSSRSAAPQEGSLEHMVGQMVVAGFRGTEDRPDSDLRPIIVDIAKGRVGGIIIFDYDVALKQPVRNVVNPKQLSELINDLKRYNPYPGLPLFTAVDQEGGKVMRLKPKHGFPETYSAQDLGAKDDLDFTRRAGAQIGKVLAEMGLNLNLAPVVDVNVNPDNPAIGKLGRSFSGDPQKTAEHALAFIQGLHEFDVLSCLKHFPGHGSTWNDSHHGMADVTETWTRKELVPYKRLIKEGVVDAIMTAHVFNADLDPEHPATLSKKIITGLLREELGFDGVVVSDDMQMKAVTEFYGFEKAVLLAVQAGVDILLFGNNLVYDPDAASKTVDLILQYVDEGKISRERIQASYNRIRKLKARLQ